ncbi:MAG TPA: Hsp70 family protein, partial [Planctomycetaceae bacterium]|nr:Hsp70 family protein [Planctomycetaceae bacterium]
MQPEQGQTVGIDLGTTYSAVAQLNESGVPISLKNSEGKTTTPSIVLFGDGGQITVGPSFERLSSADPTRVVESIKREMGNKNFVRIYQNKKLTPEFISALILKKLKQDAESQIGPIANAVITVPYYFNDHCRKATQDAGKIAGLNVIDILNEPTAATLAYAWLQGELGRADLKVPEKTILVYDLGGGTFDVTVVRYSPLHFRVLATDGDVRLGGLDWTRRMVDYVADQFRKRFGADPRTEPDSMMQLSQQCEMAKRTLSEAASAHVDVRFHGRGMTVPVGRHDFEHLTADLLQRTRDTVELVLQLAGVD